MSSGRLDHLSYDQLRELRKRHGYRRKEAKAVLHTRQAPTQDQNSSNSQDLQGNSDIPVASTGKRGLPTEDAAEPVQGPTVVLTKRRKRGALRVASVAGKEVVKGHARW